jgi:ABC-2 type transport system permease protein
MSSVTARVADRRFQHYTGVRRGELYATVRLLRSSFLRSIGFGKGFRSFVLPALLAVIAYFPAVVTLIGSFAGAPPGFGPSYSDLVPISAFALFCYIALVGPELVCPDRRTGALVMYMTACLRPATYLVAKVLAVIGLLAILTIGPATLLLLANAYLGTGPKDLAAFLTVAGHILGAGLMFATFFGVLGLAAASLTDRRAFAAAGIILGLVLVSAALGIAEGPLKAPSWVGAFNLSELPNEAAYRIYGHFPRFYSAASHSFTTLQLALAIGGWIAAGGGLLFWRYHSEGAG